ncbi:hypothetical protein [Flavobacterium sp.]|uniref:hypothetical protein n=1 Tax=Flavobacterium sp. TaxID=239 RepID=UPI002B4B2A3D|nr:hypothetical protein [Flavobacterium sp.]HLP63150.1 hypothetical protein [Flavobacterium sp.]
MDKKVFLKISYYFVLAILLYSLSIQLWDYFHEGVPSHHFLANKNLPKVSNWWGIISLPLAVAFLLYRIQLREFAHSNSIEKNKIKRLILHFGLAFLYAMIIAVSFSTDNSPISSFFFFGIFAFALFFPLYKSEFCLGFILGLSYTFGGVLPLVICLFLAIICFVLLTVSRLVWVKLVKR